MRGSKRFFIEYMAPLAVALALCGCSRLAVEPKVEAGSVRGEVVTAGLAAPEAVYSTGGWPLRTLAPDPVAVNDLATTQYTLKIRGESHRDSLPEQVVQLNADGSFVIPSLSYGVWRLTLTAYRGASATALLTGSSSVTVDGSPGTTARFVLTPAGVAGTGTVALTINWSTADRVVMQSNTRVTRYVRMALYYPGTNAQVPGTEGVYSRNGGTAGTIPTSVAYYGQNSTTPLQIPAGEYELRFWMAGGGIPAGVTLTWRDNVYIEPGRETRQSVTIPQMAVVPASPANPRHAKGNTFDAWTDVTFSWNGVYNASRYEVEAIEYTNGTHPTTDQTWTALSNVAANIKTYYNAVPEDGNNYAGGANHARENLVLSGGLLPGQNSFELRLRGNGRKYAVRVRAVNVFGKSPWVYFPELAFALPAAPAAPTNFSFTTNRYDGATDSFDAHFSWTDNADNERGYELQLLRFSTGTTPRNDGDWTARGGAATAGGNTSGWKGEVIFSTTGDPVAYASGGLGENSTRLSLKIKRHTGKSYYAVRIRSYNDGGVSAWVYPPAGSLLMPVSYIESHSTGSIYTTNHRVFDVTLNIMDKAGSTCTYQFGFIFLMSGNDSYLNLLRMDTEAARDAEWARLLNLPANNTAAGRGGQRQVDGTNPAIRQLNVGVPFPFRVRTVIMNGGAVVDSTPWTYYYPPVFVAQPQP